MYVSTSEIVQKANSIVAQCGTRDPNRIARDLGIEVRYYPFKEQRGAYKVIMRNRFIFLKNDLHPVMENIVLLHEIGHDLLHREEATKAGGFKEFEIFNMRNNRMEYEAKHPEDSPSIGLLLCKSKNDLVAEYALKDMSKPIGVSEYKITSSLPENLSKQLPSIEDIQKRIKN